MALGWGWYKHSIWRNGLFQEYSYLWELHKLLEECTLCRRGLSSKTHQISPFWGSVFLDSLNFSCYTNGPSALYMHTHTCTQLESLVQWLERYLDAGARLPGFKPGYIILHACDPNQINQPLFALVSSFVKWSKSWHLPQGLLCGLDRVMEVKYLEQYLAYTCVLCFFVALTVCMSIQ